MKGPPGDRHLALVPPPGEGSGVIAGREVLYLSSVEPGPLLVECGAIALPEPARGVVSRIFKTDPRDAPMRFAAARRLAELALAHMEPGPGASRFAAVDTELCPLWLLGASEVAMRAAGVEPLYALWRFGGPWTEIEGWIQPPQMERPPWSS